MIVLKVDMLVKPGAEEKCKEYIRILQQHSRRELGCMMYVGHQSTEDPRKFLFYEQYRDQAALDAHRAAPYFKQYVHGGLDPIMEQRTRELYALVEQTILVLSNVSDPGIRVFVDATKVLCLMKPFEVADLLAVTRRLLRRAKAAAHSRNHGDRPIS